MNPVKTLLSRDATQEIAALIEKLHQTEQRLQELTAGEVDAVADHEGRTILLRQAQEQLRHIDAAKQAVVLNALPAQIALLDQQGQIISVNEAWRRFAIANVLQGPGFGIGFNYLAICDNTRGEDASIAQQAAKGIRSVLRGATSFSFEYTCRHSPTEQRWFLMTVTPLADTVLNGAVVMHLNITDRKRAEIASLRLAAIVESSGDAIIGKDLDGIVTSWNKGAEDVFGYSANEMVGTSITRLLPGGRPADVHILKKIKRGENVGHFETLRLKKDGRLVEISVTASPIKDAAGKVIGASISARDISARKRAEAALRTSEQMFRQMAEAITDVFYIQSLDGTKIYYVSPAYEYIWGRTCESLYQNPASWADAIHPDDLHLALVHLNEDHVTGFDYEVRIVRPNGETRWIHIRGFPIPDAAGNPYRTAGVCSDITLRKQAADELRTSEGLKRAIMESSLDCIVAIDHEGKIVEFNPTAEKTFGLTRAQVLGRAMAELIVPPGLRAAHTRGFDQYIATGVGPILGKRLELTAVRADGAEFPIELAITAIGGTSKPMFTGFLRDITVQQADQTRLRESESRFRSLTSLSADWFWEQDEKYRFTQFSGTGQESVWGNDRSAVFGLRRWELPGVTPVSEGWDEHKAQLEARKSFRDFEYKRTLEDGTSKYVAVSGEPVFDLAGRFTGYRGVATDITERKRAVQVLRESERRFSNLLGSVELASVMLDRDARITYCNEFLLRLTGWRSEEVIGRDWFEIFMPAELGDMKPAFKALLANLPEAWHRDQEIFTRSSERRLIRWSNSVLRSPSGEVIGTASIGEDITERIRAEEALRMSEMQQRKVAEQLEIERSRLVAAQQVAKIGSWETDVMTMSVIWSVETHRIHETDPATFHPTHQRFLEFVHPEDRAKVDGAFSRSLGRHADNEVIEHRLLLPDGRIKFIEERWRVSFDAQDRPVRAVGTCQDITERKQAETALRKSRERLALATQSAHIGIWDWEVGTKKLMWDTQMFALNGIREEDCSSTFDAWRNGLHPDDRDRAATVLADALDGCNDVHTEFRVVWPNGEVRDIEAHFLVQRTDNNATRLIGANWDITERKRAENEVRRLNADLERRVEERTVELQAANRELEAFDYSVSHDLKAPIRHVEGFSNILIEEYGDKLDARGRDYLGRMQSAGQRMGQLVDDLLALSLISRSELNRREIDLSALSRQVFDSLQQTEPGRDIEFVATPGLKANADRGLLRIVLENLIGNAWKFTTGRIGAKVEFGITMGEDGPVFFVRDNGAGFDAAYADKLFAPFQRLHSESEFNGTGIGLATVRRVITRHGGQVWAEGGVNRGATIHFTLPL